MHDGHKVSGTRYYSEEQRFVFFVIFHSVLCGKFI